MSKLLTVIGSTGNQGGSIIETILNDPELSKEYKLRGITRDPSKPAGEKLKSKGVEVVKGDLMSKDSLKEAFKGSYAVFGVTNFWETASKETELKQGHNIADAAKEAGVEVFIWSSLPNVTAISNGKLPNVAHFDGKAEIGDYAKSIGLSVIEVLPGFYYPNLKSMIRKNEGEESYTLAWPLPASTPIHFFNPQTDTGKFVAGVLADPQQYFDKQVLETTLPTHSPGEVIEEFKKSTGKECRYVELTDDQFRDALPMPPVLKQEMLENFILIRDFGYYGKNAQADLEFSQTVPRGNLTTLSEAIRELGPW